MGVRLILHSSFVVSRADPLAGGPGGDMRDMDQETNGPCGSQHTSPAMPPPTHPHLASNPSLPPSPRIAFRPSFGLMDGTPSVGNER